MTETKQSGTLTRDPEISMLAKLDRALGQMDKSAAARVLAWLWAKYCVDGPCQAAPGDPVYRRGIVNPANSEGSS